MFQQRGCDGNIAVLTCWWVCNVKNIPTVWQILLQYGCEVLKYSKDGACIVWPVIQYADVWPASYILFIIFIMSILLVVHYKWMQCNIVFVEIIRLEFFTLARQNVFCKIHLPSTCFLVKLTTCTIPYWFVTSSLCLTNTGYSLENLSLNSSAGTSCVTYDIFL